MTMAKHWYKVDFAEGETIRNVVGTAEFSVAQVVQQIQAGEFLLLSDLTYRDNQGHLQPYSKWDQNLPPRMYINPKYIVSVGPYDGDPRTSAGP
jgi:hypothetical protein